MTNPLRMSRARKANKLILKLERRAAMKRFEEDERVFREECSRRSYFIDWNKRLQMQAAMERLPYCVVFGRGRGAEFVIEDVQEELAPLGPPKQNHDPKYPPSWNPLKWRWFDHTV